MPQLDIFSYFSVTIILIMSFIVLLFGLFIYRSFCLHAYLLQKIAKILKFRKKYAKRQKDILLFLTAKFKWEQTPCTLGFISFSSEELLSKFLSYFSFISLLLSLLYLILSISISSNGKANIVGTFIQYLPMQKILMLALILSRNFNALSLKDSKYLSLSSAMLLALSTLFRLYVTCGIIKPTNLLTLVLIIIFYTLFFCNTLFRLGLTLGYTCDTKYPNITYTLGENMQKIFSGSIRGFQRWYTPHMSPPGAPQTVYFRKYAIVIAAISVPFLGYTAYETHYSRLAAERTADAAEAANRINLRNVEATETANRINLQNMEVQTRHTLALEEHNRIELRKLAVGQGSLTPEEKSQNN